MTDPLQIPVNVSIGFSFDILLTKNIVIHRNERVWFIILILV